MFTPGMFAPAMFTPAMFTPAMFTPAWFLHSPTSRFVLCFFCSVSALGQQAAAPSGPAMGPAIVREFPVLLQSNVVGGKTAAGTKIQAKLTVATLVDGTVIPRNAVFSGEVTESVAKTKDGPSRVAIRMDSEQWKGGTATITAYLTAWYYPPVADAGQNLQYGPTQSAKATWNGQGQYPDSNSHVYQPFPGGSDSNANAPDTTTSVASNHRVVMRDVESEIGNDGAITIVSKKSNLKLDKLTTYVLATGPLQLPPPARPASK